MQLHAAAGAGKERALREAMAAHGVAGRVVAHCSDMGAAYSAADLALCRGGAATVAELWLHRLPAVVVPYPGHADRQQELNARALEPGVRVLGDGAAVRAAVLELLDDAAERRAMSRSLAASAPPDGLAQAVGMLEEMAARFA